MVVCSVRQWHWAWPLAMSSSVLYGVVFFQNRLYGESLLQGLFVVLALWGWWQWLRRLPSNATGSDSPQPQVQTTLNVRSVRRLTRRAWAWTVFSCVLLWLGLSLTLHRYTDSDVPLWDGLTTAGSIVAQVLMGYKFLENWALWLLINLVSIALFAHKSLGLTAALYAVLAFMSVLGWRQWRRDSLVQHAQASSA